MIKQFNDMLIGEDFPIRVGKSFYSLAKNNIIGDKKVRKALEKRSGKKYFGSFKDFSDYAATKLEQDLNGRFP